METLHKNGLTIQWQLAIGAECAGSASSLLDLIKMRARGELDEQDYAQELSSVEAEIARHEIVEEENIVD